MRGRAGKGHGSKLAVPRHRVQSRVSSDSQERAIERQERQAARRDIEERVVTEVDAWGHTRVVGGHITVEVAS